MENSSNKLLKALIIGATGATGRELTDILVNSQHYSEIYVIVRRSIDRWENYNITQKEKLHIIKYNDLGILGKDKNEIISTLNKDFSDINTVFCCLGSRVGRGESEFIKVDYDFVLYSASLCEKFNIPHYTVVSSKGADPKSWFLYMRTKGKADEAVLKMDIPYISVFRPGAILDRDNDDRFAEKCLKFIPFIPKITSVNLARTLMIDDLDYHLKRKELKGARIITHSDILDFVKNEKL
jgi:oxidoreductase